MSEAEGDDIAPVVTPGHMESQPPVPHGDFYSKCVFWFSLFLAGSALIGSFIGFAGFFENDRNITHLISAFLLCFGLGSLAYIPLLLIAVYARQAILKPLPRDRAIVVLLLVLPWFFVSFYSFQLGGALRYGATLAGLSCLFISGWALRYLRRE